MTSTIRLMCLLALGIGALLLTSPAQGQDDDSDGGNGECNGCFFWLVGPHDSNNGTPNACGTDVRLTIMGSNGACEGDADGGCQPVAPCFSMIQIDVRSQCPMTLDYEFGPVLGSVPLPPSPGGVWNSIVDPTFAVLGCGSPMQIVSLTVSDATGYEKSTSALYGCTPCQ